MSVTTDSLKERWLILGASRGLGRAFSLEAAQTLGPESELLLVARKRNALESLRSEVEEKGIRAEVLSADFALKEAQPLVLEKLADWNPQRIFYFAGGGPYGRFEDKDWKDHEWALQVSALFPLRLLHASLKWPKVQQWVFIGSAIAENSADPFAVSYAASKHALLGALRSVQAETSKDIRMFSPGYMDTDLLPPNAKARQGGRLWPVEIVGRKLRQWSLQKPEGEGFHLTLADYAER